MTKPIDFFWFIPTSGDGAYLGASDLSRAPDYPYLREIAVAVDRLGYKGVLLPTGVACEESFVMAAALAPATEAAEVPRRDPARRRLAGLLRAAVVDARPGVERAAAPQHRRRRQPGGAGRRRRLPGA